MVAEIGEKYPKIGEEYPTFWEHYYFIKEDVTGRSVAKSFVSPLFMSVNFLTGHFWLLGLNLIVCHF